MASWGVELISIFEQLIKSNLAVSDGWDEGGADDSAGSDGESGSQLVAKVVVETAAAVVEPVVEVVVEATAVVAATVASKITAVKKVYEFSALMFPALILYLPPTKDVDSRIGLILKPLV